MFSNLLAGFKLDDISCFFAEITSYIFVVIDVPKETNALRILSARVDKMLAFCNIAHFILYKMADGKDSFLKLPAVNLCEKIRLIFHGIGASYEPFLPIDNLSLSIMSSGNEVIVVPFLLMKSAKFNKTVTHHVRIRGKTCFNLFHSIACNLIPIFVMTINYLQTAPKTAGYSGCHFEVFLRTAVPFLFLFRTNFNIETIRMNIPLYKFVQNNTTVYATR